MFSKHALNGMFIISRVEGGVRGVCDLMPSPRQVGSQDRAQSEV